jgi:hypothetical protein
MECLQALKGTPFMAPAMEQAIRARLNAGRPEDVATICFQLRAEMLTAGLWTLQDLLDFSEFDDGLREFVQQMLDAGCITFTIARHLISTLGPIGQQLMQEVDAAIKELLDDSRLDGVNIFRDMKPTSDMKTPRFHSTVIADASRGVGGQPDVRVECSLEDILKVNRLVHGRKLCDVIAADAYTCLIPGHGTRAALNSGNPQGEAA